MKFIITFIMMSNLTLLSQGWLQTAELDTVRYRQIISSGESTYLFTYHTREIAILRSTNDGVTWDTLVDGNPKGFEKEFPSVLEVINENIAFVCLGSKGNIFKYNFSDNSIENLKIDATFYIASIKMIDEDNGICGTDSELFITDDGWKTTQKIDVNDLSEVYINYENDKLIYSYLTSDEGLEIVSKYFRSEDKGESWIETDLGEIIGLEMVVKEDNSIFITASKYIIVDEKFEFFDIIIKSTDNGKTWEEMLNKSFDHRVDLDDIKFYNNQIGIACGQNTSTYLTFDGGETWEIQNVEDVEELSLRPTFGGFTQTKFILGIWNKGLFQKEISISSVNWNSTTTNYLNNNSINLYPNPVEKQTTIEFELTQSTNVTMDVYDATGNKLEGLVSKYMTQGNWGITWTPNNLVSGAYFIQMTTDYGTFTQKVIVK